jgi:hypothetical protein
MNDLLHFVGFLVALLSPASKRDDALRRPALTLGRKHEMIACGIRGQY